MAEPGQVLHGGLDAGPVIAADRGQCRVASLAVDQDDGLSGRGERGYLPAAQRRRAIRAHVPAVLRTFSASWQQVFREGVLDHRIKELARLYVATSLECGYCAGQRSHIAAAQGVTEDKYDDLIDFRRSDRYDDRERAALRWAEAIAWDPGSADDDLWSELHKHFSEPELVELGYFIGLTMGQQRFLKTLQVKHGDLGTGSLAGLAPDVVRQLTQTDAPAAG